MKVFQKGLIGFTGAGGTGKTTTAKILAERLGIPMVPSVAREVLHKHGVVKEDDQYSLSPQQILQMEYDIFDATDIRDQATPVGVCDRTPLDQLAYTLLRCHTILDQYKIDSIVRRILELMNPYSVIVYFPLVTYQDHDDGMRTNAQGSRAVFNMILQDLLRNNYPRVQYHTCPPTGYRSTSFRSPADRAEGICKMVLDD